MPDAVLVCKREQCKRIFYRPVTRLIYGSVGKDYCSRFCYLEDVSPKGIGEWQECEEPDVLRYCTKVLARAILVRAVRDLKNPEYRRDAVTFLYSPNVRLLREWAFS